MDKTRLTIYLTETIRKQLKIYAAQTDRSLSDIVEQAIEDYIKANPAN